ncbi:MAG: hypothetical protein Q7U38_17820 [Methylobacter sp.]|nr:hypothetical protein [Methylobacter sp.]MDP2099129.1 hypothetical protein [Methylobacter sp.]MDP2429955.1 hypothetical protein [Methylobacter sp.]MDP3054800.1 hypothetical protein [Methylobacter sp.]MDP3361216.1 hypothetical protein [Methylobacter sp.]
MIEKKAVSESLYSYETVAYKTANEEISLIENDLNTDQLIMKKINQRIATLEADLLSCNSNVNVSDLLEHQKAIETAQAELDKYQSLIDQQESKIAGAAAKECKVTPLISKREELMADIALGKTPAENLAKLDNEIDRTRKAQEAEQTSNANIITDAKNTIAGLERRAQTVKYRIRDLNDRTPIFFDFVLMDMAKKSREDYERIIQELGRKLIELRALDTIISTSGKRVETELFPGDWWFYQIPNMNNVKLNEENAINLLKQGMIEQGIKI